MSYDISYARWLYSAHFKFLAWTIEGCVRKRSRHHPSSDLQFRLCLKLRFTRHDLSKYDWTAPLSVANQKLEPISSFFFSSIPPLPILWNCIDIFWYVMQLFCMPISLISIFIIIVFVTYGQGWCYLLSKSTWLHRIPCSILNLHHVLDIPQYSSFCIFPLNALLYISDRLHISEQSFFMLANISGNIQMV